MQASVLYPACQAGAQYGVGIAGPHIHYRAIGALLGARRRRDSVLSASASIHQFILRRGGSCVVYTPQFRSIRLMETVRAEALTTRRRAPPGRAEGDAAGCTFSAPKRNSVPSNHIRCMMTASLRATAVTARLWPRRAAIRTPQAFTVHHFFDRTSMPLAAS